MGLLKNFEVSSTFRKNFIFWISILGIMISIKLMLVYFNANFVENAAPSFCSINETIDCDAVARTQYSLFLGVPLAVYGLFFYILICFLNFVDELKGFKFLKFLEVFKNPQSYIFSFSAISIIVSIILAWISHFEIHKICILCYVTYFLNLLLFIISKNGKSPVEHFKNTIKDFLAAVSQPVYSLLTVIIVAFGAAALFGVNQYELFVPKNPSLALRRDMENYREFKADAADFQGNVLGDKNGKVIIHEYTDFQCPICTISNAMMYKLVSEVDNVMVIHHDFPLDKSCNPIMKTPGHKNSCLYAKYGIAAKNQQKFQKFALVVFDDNENLTEAIILKRAKSIGLDITKLKTDAYSPNTAETLKYDINKAIKFGIVATPSYRIGIKIHEGIMPYEDLKSLVMSEGGRLK